MDTKPTTEAPQQKQVMDIQPPQPAAVATEPHLSEETTENEAQTTEKTVPLAAAVPTDKKQTRTPLLAIVLAVGLAVVFGTLAVLAYRDNAQTAQPTASQKTETTAKETVTPAAVDETNAAVDESFKGLDDATEFDDSSLSDTTLGL